jgi:formylglycine-generating enzyme required for sulfatase activity
MTRATLALLFVGGFGVLSASAAEPKPQEKVWRNPRDGMEFVWIPAGNFTAEVLDKDKKPSDQHIAFPDGFWMGRTEVTVGQFRRFVEQTGHVTEPEKAKNRWTWKKPWFPQEDDHPVIYLGYSDALKYAEWAGVDVPTEAEWLYACRAGTSTVFYWGDKMDDRHVWHRGNAGDATRPVAKKQSNPWGLYDMIGNAHEWCTSGKIGVLRGGSFTRCDRYRFLDGNWIEPFNWEVGLRLHDGSPLTQYPWDDDRGFRCVKRAE